jgi:hypothetical protein
LQSGGGKGGEMRTAGQLLIHDPQPIATEEW